MSSIPDQPISERTTRERIQAITEFLMAENLMRGYGHSRRECELRAGAIIRALNPKVEAYAKELGDRVSAETLRDTLLRRHLECKDQLLAMAMGRGWFAAYRDHLEYPLAGERLQAELREQFEQQTDELAEQLKDDTHGGMYLVNLARRVCMGPLDGAK